MPPLQVSVNVSVPTAVGVSVTVPVTACDPLHAPLAVQVVPLVADQVRVDDCPSTIEVGVTVIVTAEGVGELPGAW
jgi:hypothetical protein